MDFTGIKDRNQLPLTISLDESIPEKSIARLIEAIAVKVYNSNKKEFDSNKQYPQGRPAYHPIIMLSLFIYGFIYDTRSSRRLEHLCQVNKEVIWLVYNETPHYWAINHFLTSHREIVKKTAKQFVRFLRAKKYVSNEKIYHDSTRIKAYNSPYNYMNLDLPAIQDRLNMTEVKIEEYMNMLLSDADTEGYPYNDPGIREQAEKELARLQKENQEYKDMLIKAGLLKQVTEDAAAAEAPGKNTGKKVKVYTTDPEAKTMKTRKSGYFPGYTLQASVCAKHGFIASSYLTDSQSDNLELPEAVKHLQEHLGIIPEELILDAGYYNPRLRRLLESTYQIKIYVKPIINDRNKKENDSGIDTRKEAFIYNETEDCYYCPKGKKLQRKSRNQERGNWLTEYRCSECLECPLFGKCTTSKEGRTISIYDDEKERKEYEKMMNSPEGKERMYDRKRVVEAPFGILKLKLGLIQTYFRGLEKTAAFFNMLILGFNIKKYIKIAGFQQAMADILSYQW